MSGNSNKTGVLLELDREYSYLSYVEMEAKLSRTVWLEKLASDLKLSLTHHTAALLDAAKSGKQ